MAIYTRTGDDGLTCLRGGVRVSKDDAQVEMLGEMDEANSFLGLLRSKISPQHGWQISLRNIQRDFMKLMSFLAAVDDEALPKLNFSAAQFEQWIDENEKITGAIKFFVLPAGNEVAALCHLLRCKVRKCERQLVSLRRHNMLGNEKFNFVSPYLNRLADLFFSLAIVELHNENLDEEKWKLFRTRDED